MPSDVHHELAVARVAAEESLREATRLYAAGQKLRDALLWCVPDLQRSSCSSFYAPGREAIKAWDEATDEGSYS
jgi:hypothetical protein